jgi:hypothetical protein
MRLLCKNPLTINTYQDKWSKQFAKNVFGKYVNCMPEVILEVLCIFAKSYVFLRLLNFVHHLHIDCGWIQLSSVFISIYIPSLH